MISEKQALQIPFMYTLYSRGGVFSIVNSYVYGPTMIALYALLFTDVGDVWNFMVVVLVSYVLFALQYEIGYLTNDLVSIKSEKNPTLRTKNTHSLLSAAQAISVRLLCTAVIYILLLLLDFKLDFFLSTFLYALMGLSLVYLSHNFLHLIHTSVRVITFSLLKVSFWLIPSLYAFIQLPAEIMSAFLVTFFGAYLFYIYSYSLNKKWISSHLEKFLPYDLELKLLLFITIIFTIFYPLVFVGLEFFIGYVYVFVLTFWIIRLFGRVTIKQKHESKI